MGNRARAVAVALVAVVGACGKSGTAPSPATLAGTWRATKVEYVNLANSCQKVELVSSGAAYTLVLTAARTFTLTGTHPGDAPISLAGTYEATDVLTLTYTSGAFGEAQFDMSLNGNTLTLSGGHAPYDVDGDDQDEESLLNMVLARQ